MNLWPYLTGLDNFETKGISERICQYDVRDSCSNNITRWIKKADKVHFGLTKGCHCYEYLEFKKIIALANLSKVCFITLIWLFITFLCKSFCTFFYQKNMFLFPIMCVQCLVIPIQYPYVIVRHISLYQRNETFAYLLYDNYLYILYRIKSNNSEKSSELESCTDY